MDDTASIQKFLAAMSRGPSIQPNKYSSRTIEPQNSSNGVAENTSTVLKSMKADADEIIMRGTHSPSLIENAKVSEITKETTPDLELSNAKPGDNNTESTSRSRSTSVEPTQGVLTINKPEAKSPPKSGHVDWYKNLKERMDGVRKAQGPMDPRLTQNYSPIPPEYEERCIAARDTIRQVLESYSSRSSRSSRPSSSHSSQGQGSVIQGFARTRTFASKTTPPQKTHGPSEQSRMAEPKDSRAGSPTSQGGENWIAPHLRGLKKDHRGEDVTKAVPEQSANVQVTTPLWENKWTTRRRPSPDYSDRTDGRSLLTTEETTPSPLQLSQEKSESAQEDGSAPHPPTMTPCPQSLKHSSPAKEEFNEPPSKKVPTVSAPKSVEVQEPNRQPAPSIAVNVKDAGEGVHRESVLYFKSWGAPQQRERPGTWPFSSLLCPSLIIILSKQLHASAKCTSPPPLPLTTPPLA